jgi:hypothetical protein
MQNWGNQIKKPSRSRTTDFARDISRSKNATKLDNHNSAEELYLDIESL